MTVASLTKRRMLGPYADVILLFGSMLHEDVRTSPEGRPMLVAATLAAWASSGALSGFVSAHRQLPLLVAEALEEHALPNELTAAITAFPTMLRDLGAWRVEQSGGETGRHRRALLVHRARGAPTTQAADATGSRGGEPGVKSLIVRSLPAYLQLASLRLAARRPPRFGPSQNNKRCHIRTARSFSKFALLFNEVLMINEE